MSKIAFFYNSPKLETTKCPSTGKWMNRLREQIPHFLAFRVGQASGTSHTICLRPSERLSPGCLHSSALLALVSFPSLSHLLLPLPTCPGSHPNKPLALRPLSQDLGQFSPRQFYLVRSHDLLSKHSSSHNYP